MKKSFFAFVLACCAVLCLAVAPGAQAKTILKLSHNEDTKHPFHMTMEVFAKNVADYSNGDLEVRIYPNGTLGSQRESVELLRTGAIQLVKTNAAELEAFDAAYKLFNLPYLFSSRDHYYKIIQGPIGKEILASSKPNGYVGLAFFDDGARSFYGNKPILKPEDLKGMKVRVQPSPSAIAMVTMMGGNPTPLDYGELYTALQQGVVDMAENSVMALTTKRHGEVAKAFSLDEHTRVPDVLLIGNAVYEGLSDKNREALDRAAGEATAYMKDLWTQQEEKEFASLDSMGVKVYTVDKKPFFDIVQPMYTQFEKENPGLAPLLERIKSEQ